MRFEAVHNGYRHLYLYQLLDCREVRKVFPDERFGWVWLSLSLRFKDLLGPVTSVKRKKKSGAIHTVLPWEAFGGHVPFGGSIKSILERVLSSGAILPLVKCSPLCVVCRAHGILTFDNHFRD